MSNAIICDECGRILKSSDALHCYEVLTKEGGTVYGADICKDCLPQFDRKADIHGWNLSYKKELKGRAAENQSVTNCNRFGNAAKMREALKRADAALSLISKSAWFIDANFAETKAVIEAGNAIEAALSAPPRNCDRAECATTKSAQKVWRKEDGGKTAYYEWLLETSTKGETK